ncbi:hypothetical protein LTR66_000354 [Elasticomyces elasticus]|nr:hypothetical protein LTR66_000354 [Elasticomyces elasticus]
MPAITTSTMPLPTTSSKPPPKVARKTQSRTVILRLNPNLLARWPSDSLPKEQPDPEPPLLPAPLPAIQTSESSPVDKSSESNATPVPNSSAANQDAESLSAPPANSKKRKSVPGQKLGSKRSPSRQPSDGLLKPRGKPGPKKKPRLADGTIDRSLDTAKKGPFAGPNPISTHKLGPKANQGAINEKLRALDRTGKPCRKWERKGFQLKSFTGYTFSAGSWRAPQKPNFGGDVKSDSSGSSDMKNNESSVVQSERSNSGEAGQTNGVESSPATQVAADA